MPVSLVTVHHEGSPASPCSAADCWRFAHGGYSYGVGTDTFARFRSPSESWGTLNYNHLSLDCCLSSCRHPSCGNFPVTDHDLEVMRAIFMDCYNRGEVTANPTVRAHKNSPGSATACPGDRTMDRWNEVAACFRLDAPKPPEPEDDVTDLANAFNHDGRPIVFQVGGDAKLYMKIRDASGGGWGSWRDLSGGKSGFATVTAFVNDSKPPKIELWVTMKDGKTYNRWQADNLSDWEPWVDQTR